MTNSVGVALGGGGARGLAHMQALEVIDCCGIRPVALAGTSMGALIGTLYAAGISGGEMRERFNRHTLHGSEPLNERLSKSGNLFQWLRGVRPQLTRAGLLNATMFLRNLLKEVGVESFEDLHIPLQIIATDFWSGEEVVFHKGPLLPAISASIAIPGVFTPVVVDGRVLVDGGLVNNVPFDRLRPLCEHTVAIDVSRTRPPDGNHVPGMVDSIVGMFDLLIKRNTEARIAQAPPSIYIKPAFTDIRILDFHKSASVFHQAEPAMARLREALDNLPGLHHDGK